MNDNPTTDYVLVPKEPTEAMIMAAMRQTRPGESCSLHSWWTAMLAARPSTPEKPKDEDDYEDEEETARLALKSIVSSLDEKKEADRLLEVGHARIAVLEALADSWIEFARMTLDVSEQQALLRAAKQLRAALAPKGQNDA